MIRKSSRARAWRPELANAERASRGDITMGLPWMLKEVFRTPPIPDIEANFVRRSW